MHYRLIKQMLAAAFAFAAVSLPALELDPKSNSVDIPVDWKGKSVRFEQRIAFIELDVIVNGKKAGTALAPEGSVEIAPFLKFGQKNEITFAERPATEYKGRGDGPYGNPNPKGRHLISKAQLEARTTTYLDDFYVKPSWRQKKLTVDAEIESMSKEKVEVTVEIRDTPAGAVIKRGTATATVTPGSSVVTVEIPWENPVCWEPVAHAKMYDCKVLLKAGGKACDARRESTPFGFREIWREGKDIYLNGHIQRFRGFWNQGMPKEINDLHKYGYNLSYETHKHWAYYFEDENAMRAKSEAGIAVFTGMPSIYFVHDDIRNNPKCTEAFRRSLKAWMRTWRNYPCIVAASCGVNQICPERNMRPEILGQDPEKGGGVDNIEFARTVAREYNDNCLYFSHADGNEADISSSNLYFNFTPLQEREEWLKQWSEKGAYPWYAAEFGAPYYACWFHSRVPQMTEWLATYYGPRAYLAEKESMLENAKAYAKDCMNKTHGGWVKGQDLYAHNDLAEEYSRMLVYRTNRAWRYFGLNGGLMYLTSWRWDDPNTMRDRQMMANGDIITFLGGDPEVTDRTHAYWAGDTIRKCLAFAWDGVGATTVTAKWRLVDAAGKEVASGSAKKALKQGDITKEPIEVTAPSVKTKTAYKFEVVFDGPCYNTPANLTVKTDSFDFEVYPKEEFRIKAPRGTKIALFDPLGKTAEIFEKAGLEVTAYESVADALKAKPTHLVIGWRALTQGQGLEKAEAQIADGLKVIVFQQTSEVWQLLGFTIEDSMARRMFNVALGGVDDNDLAHWAGSPVEDVAFGNVMKHETRRGPRWTHTHAVSGTPILIPQRGGFTPLVRGEFDLSYSALLKALRGKGSVTFCAFDFEGRVGACPAATKVFTASMDDFLRADKIDPVAEVLVDGAHAERLAKTLGLDAVKFDGKSHKDAVLIVGKDSKLTAAQVKDALGRRSRALVVANDTVAEALAGGLETNKLFYTAKNGDPLLRARDGIDYRPLKGGDFQKEFKNILVDQLDPFQAADRYRTGDGKAAVLTRGGWGSVPKGEKDLYLRNASQSEDNFMRRHAMTLAKWGVSVGRKVFARSLYTKPAEAYEPIAQYNVLGPWPSKNDDSHYMVDTIFPVDESKGGDSGALAEEMAIKGDVQPNPRFHPLGLVYLKDTPKDLWFLDWRPVVKSRADGFVDYGTAHPLIAAQSFCTCYCVGFLKRRTAGKITIRFGVDWRGKIWVNGKAFEPIYGGFKDEGSVIYKDVDVHAGDNVITVKAGCGQSAKTFWLNVSHEPQPGEVVRDRVKELDDVKLYESANERFDPYEFVYW